MQFSDVTFMKPLPSVSMANDDQTLMREWLGPFRPVRQRTVCSETTKDKAGALPPSVYMSDPSTYSLYSLASEVPEDIPTINPFDTPTTTVQLIYITTNVTIETSRPWVVTSTFVPCATQRPGKFLR